MNRASYLLPLLCLPLCIAKANATIIVSTSSDLQSCDIPGQPCPPAPMSTFNGGLIVNGDFGNGNFSGFSGTATQNKDRFQGGVMGNSNHTPSYAYLASAGFDQTLYQTFATTPGDTYSISFLLGNFNNYPDQSEVEGSLVYDFTAAFGNQTLLSIANPAFPANGNDRAYSFTAVANNTSTTLLFTSRNDPGAFSLTNISVMDSTSTVPSALATASTPEPSSLVLLGTGVLSIFGAARRRVRALR